jgi:hypothetical protein
MLSYALNAVATSGAVSLPPDTTFKYNVLLLYLIQFQVKMLNRSDIEIGFRLIVNNASLN